MSETKKKKPTGKKGGSLFPKMNLADAVGYAQKLVSKTHVGPQPADTILPGVFGAASWVGGVKASALKQYGLLGGTLEGYFATELAKQMAMALPEEVDTFRQIACLKPKVFKTLFDTFNGDTVSLAKLKQQASAVGVHPDSAEDCVAYFSESAVFANLGALNEDALKLVPANSAKINPTNTEETNINSDDEVQEEPQGAGVPQANQQSDDAPSPSNAASARSVIQVNVTIDSSLDTDKLERQLALLRKYGAI